MNYNVNSDIETFITVSKKRLKKYDGNKFYLKNGDCFEIEIFNPTSNSVLAKLDLNGTSTFNKGIVIKPGQRVFLERFLESNNKFKFYTYDVDIKDKKVKKAIKDNGKIKISFYRESFYFSYFQPNDYCGTTFTTVNPNCYYGDTLTTDVIGTCYSGNTLTSDKLEETGRVEKGENSNQKFNPTYETFETLPFQTVNYEILPISKKINEIRDYRRYCTECGIRIKKASWRYCPGCGEKLD